MRLSMTSASVMVVFLMSLWTMPASAADLRLTGTFSNLEFDNDEGDLLGAELKVVVAERGYQGAFQIAEGEPSQLMVVDVVYVGTRISFTIPKSFARYGGGVFVGSVERAGIGGTLSFANGATSKFFLARKPSYWD